MAVLGPQVEDAGQFLLILMVFFYPNFPLFYPDPVFSFLGGLSVVVDLLRYSE